MTTVKHVITILQHQLKGFLILHKFLVLFGLFAAVSLVVCCCPVLVLSLCCAVVVLSLSRPCIVLSKYYAVVVPSCAVVILVLCFRCPGFVLSGPGVVMSLSCPGVVLSLFWCCPVVVLSLSLSCPCVVSSWCFGVVVLVRVVLSLSWYSWVSLARVFCSQSAWESTQNVLMIMLY